jgi:CheY-like chemotaxis protein
MPKKLLLADDSVTIQKVVAIALAHEDVALTSVNNGEDALTRARDLRPDLILADVVMPKKNGYELCQAIKSDPALRVTPVLLLAGTFEPFDEARARTAGADGHLMKPFETQALIDKVTQLLYKGAPRPVTQPVAAPVAAPLPSVPTPPAGALPRAPGVTLTPRPVPIPGAVARPSGTMPAAPTSGIRPMPPMPGMPPRPVAPSPGSAPRPVAPAGVRPMPPMPGSGAGLPGARPLPPGVVSPPGVRPFVPIPGGHAPAPIPPAPAPSRPAMPGPPGPSMTMPFGTVPKPVPRAPIPAVSLPPPPAPRARDPYGLEAPKPVPEVEVELGALSQVALAELAQQSNTGETRATEEIGIELSKTDIDGSPAEKVELAPLHEFVPQASAPAPATARPIAPANGSADLEATLREALGKASRELIEKIAWEVVPQLAETIIREELERLVKEKASQS